MNESIVLTVCRECGVTAEDFFGPLRDRHLTNARRIAVERLLAAGFSFRACSRLIRRNYSTVQYWVKPAYREHRKARYRLRSAESSKMPDRIPDALAVKIVNAVIAEFKIARRDLASSKFPEHVRIRKIAIRRVGAAGMNLCQIGRAVGCNRATARYWLDREYRERAKVQRIARHQRNVCIMDRLAGEAMRVGA
jgi:hypothetical protein